MLRCILFSSLLVALPACVWVSEDEFDSAWDADGDGWGLDQDCDDSNSQVYPGAPDYRGDGCDADCGFEPDSDGDDWPDFADCVPDDATIFPCSPGDVEGDGIDQDCDGHDGPRLDTQDCNEFDEAPILTCG